MGLLRDVFCCCCDCCCGFGGSGVSPDYTPVSETGDDGEAEDQQYARSGPLLKSGWVEELVDVPSGGTNSGVTQSRWMRKFVELRPMMLTLSDDESGLGRLRAVPLHEAMSQLCPRPGRPNVFEMRLTSSVRAGGGGGGAVALCVLDALEGDEKYAWIEAISGACKSEAGAHTLETVGGCLAVLGLAPENSSLPELKRAYYKLALEFHPDRGGDPNVFARVTEANHVLRSVREREAAQNRGPCPGGWLRVAVALARTSTGIGLELEDIGAAPLNAVTVSGFLPGSVAEAASEGKLRRTEEQGEGEGDEGWIAKGDIISSVDGADVRGLPLDSVFKSFMAGSRAGLATAELQFLRRLPDDADAAAAAVAAAGGVVDTVAAAVAEAAARAEGEAATAAAAAAAGAAAAAAAAAGARGGGGASDEEELILFDDDTEDEEDELRPAAAAVSAEELASAGGDLFDDDAVGI
jgi:hypothetical protein